MDATDNNNGLNAAFLAILKPIARLFLTFGRGFREFSELAKTAFVAVATDDYGVRGRPTNRSRVAAMTGLSRKEISRLRAKINAGDAASVGYRTPVRQVIDAWRSQDEFRGTDGEPAVLPLTGSQGSFQALVRRFAGDIPEGAIRKELQRIEATVVRGESIRLLPEDPGRAKAESQLVARLRAGPSPLLNAIARNPLDGDRERGGPCAALSHANVRKSDLVQVREQVAQRLRLASRQFIDLLHAYEVQTAGAGGDEITVSISAGVFYAEMPDGE